MVPASASSRGLRRALGIPGAPRLSRMIFPRLAHCQFAAHTPAGSQVAPLLSRPGFRNVRYTRGEAVGCRARRRTTLRTQVWTSLWRDKV